MTNREWLQSLDDAGVANVLQDNWCELVCGDYAKCGHEYKCEERILKWLQGECPKNDNVDAFDPQAASVNFEGGKAKKEVSEGEAAKVPNNRRLIDAEILLAEISIIPHVGDLVSSEEVEFAINDSPTVDAEPVRHGWWTRLGPNWHECSACKSRTAIFSGTKCYCPNCGAKMDGDAHAAD